jgi:hypothetical protein
LGGRCGLALNDRLVHRLFKQPFGLGHQLLAQLVGAPALPAFQFAGSGQRRVGLAVQLVINQSGRFP